MTSVAYRRVTTKVPGKKYVTKVDPRKLTIADSNRTVYASGYPAVSDWDQWGDAFLFTDPEVTRKFSELP